MDEIKVEQHKHKIEISQKAIEEYKEFLLNVLNVGIVAPEPATLHVNIAYVLNQLVTVCHDRAMTAGWYSNEDGSPKDRNIGEMLALIHSEISEALEGMRKGLMDDHLPARPMIEVELADALIRIFDLAGYLQLDLGGAFVEKLEYNLHRQDHKLETRYAEGGKKI